MKRVDEGEKRDARCVGKEEMETGRKEDGRVEVGKRMMNKQRERCWWGIKQRRRDFFL